MLTYIYPNIYIYSVVFSFFYNLCYAPCKSVSRFSVSSCLSTSLTHRKTLNSFLYTILMLYESILSSGCHKRKKEMILKIVCPKKVCQLINVFEKDILIYSLFVSLGVMLFQSKRSGISHVYKVLVHRFISSRKFIFSRQC
uniref:Uncharacterized protein n=1 Tax=Octopus bimaculoides TaxID=37653 RepID=A0A0L8G4U9_OCTBM